MMHIKLQSFQLYLLNNFLLFLLLFRNACEVFTFTINIFTFSPFIALGIKIVKLLILAITETIGMEKPFFYRNKAQYPVGYNKNGEIVTGVYAI